MSRNLAFVYQLARRYPEYAAQARVTLELALDNGTARFDLAWALVLQGQREEARAAISDVDWPLGRILVLAALGEHERGLASLREFERSLEPSDAEDDGYRDAFWLALPFAALGEADRALQLLEIAYDDRSPSMVQLNTNPALDPIRDDSRFRDLVDRMGYPEG